MYIIRYCEVCDKATQHRREGISVRDYHPNTSEPIEILSCTECGSLTK